MLEWFILHDGGGGDVTVQMRVSSQKTQPLKEKKEKQAKERQQKSKRV